jgi:hypothetical protein
VEGRCSEVMLSVVLAVLVTLLRRTWARVRRRRQPLPRNHHFNDFKIALFLDIRFSICLYQTTRCTLALLSLHCS